MQIHKARTPPRCARPGGCSLVAASLAAAAPLPPPLRPDPRHRGPGPAAVPGGGDADHADKGGKGAFVACHLVARGTHLYSEALTPVTNSTFTR